MKKLIICLILGGNIFAAKAPAANEADSAWNTLAYAKKSNLKNVALAAYPYVPAKRIEAAKDILTDDLKIPASQIPPHISELDKDPALLKTATRKVLTNHADLISKADMECKATK